LGALEHTYLLPTPGQEAAAELLGLPFSTYRYQLAAFAVSMLEPPPTAT